MIKIVFQKLIFLLEDNQIWKKDNFEAKIYHIPGHTTGHIAFHFFKEKNFYW